MIGGFKKYFTPKEANGVLARIKPVVDEILTKGRRLRSALEANPSLAEHPQAMSAQQEILGLMDTLEDWGCFFKDWNFEIGLVDFPAIVDGHEAMLCWRSDEGEVLWYHGLEDGYAHRRPIPEYWLLDMDQDQTG